MQWSLAHPNAERSGEDAVPRRRLAVRALTAAASLAAGLSILAPASALAAPEGKVNLERNATSSFAIPWITQSTQQQRTWMHDTYARMRGYPPFHDQALSWGPATDAYVDLYALYRDVAADQDLMADHPSWVLRDDAGHRLFIPWACSGGTCPAYAADIGNAQFRATWIDRAQVELTKGYKGLFIDNVNMEMQVGTGQGQQLRPIDPRTGAPMTDANWRRYVAEFTEQIRAELPPSAKITHNAGQWWAPESDQYVRRAAVAADRVELERGFNDTGLTEGGGKYGFETYLAHAEWLHAQGAPFVAEPYNLDQAKAKFELASFFLVSAGSDSISTDWRSNPDNWWSRWEANLGTASGARYTWQGLLRRDFSGGIALVNQPGAPQRAVQLPSNRTWTNLDGLQVTSVTLGAHHGAVVLGEVTEPPPPPPPDTDPPPDSEPLAVTLRPSRHRIRRGHTLRLAGAAPTAAEITILAKRRGSWRTLATGVPVAADSFSLRTKARPSGVRRYRAQAAGLDPSRTVRVRVKR